MNLFIFLFLCFINNVIITDLCIVYILKHVFRKSTNLKVYIIFWYLIKISITMLSFIALWKLFGHYLFFIFSANVLKVIKWIWMRSILSRRVFCEMSDKTFWETLYMLFFQRTKLRLHLVNRSAVSSLTTTSVKFWK